MTNPEEPTSVLEETTPLPEKLKPLKALYIVGPDLTIHNKTKALFDNRDDCLIVGDGIAAVSVKEIARILQEEGLKITQDTRIDIYAHGCRTNDGQHGILTNNPNQKITLTKQFLQELRKMADCPLNIHVWSCYGGSANKAASELKTGSTLVTHGESKSSSSPQLDAYSMIASLERYLNSEIGITSEQQFIFGYPEHLQPATFNKVGTKGKIYKFKFTRMRTSQDNKSKDKKMADILKNLSAKDNLTDYFNAFFKQEGERFQKTFEDSKVTNAINYVSKLDEQTIKTFATGVLIHLCGITTDDELNYLKELLDNLLQKGININDSIHGTTCLHRACGKGKISVIEILLKNGAEINAKNENGTIPLHWACSEGHSAVVTILLENGAEINAKNENGTIPLHWACSEGHSAVVTILLENGAEINAKNENGETPLHLACSEGHIEVVKMLLAKGVNPNIKNVNGETPLHYAYNEKHDNVVKILLADMKIDIDSKNNLLHSACKEGRINVVEILLADKDTDVNAKNSCNNTPLHYACKVGNSYVAKILLENGAEINIKGMGGNTPLHLACRKGHIEVIKELLKTPEAFGLLNIKNNYGKTPLELIPEAKKEAIVSLITKAKESIQSIDENLASDKAEDINDLLINQQMSKDSSEQLSNNEPQNVPKQTELLLVGHTEDTLPECYGA